MLTLLLITPLPTTPKPNAVPSLWNIRYDEITAIFNQLNAGKSDLASPTFTGIPAVPTATPGTSTTQAASTAFTQAAIDAALDAFSPDLSAYLSASQFTGANQSLSGNGYQKLPGGLILQWGTAAIAKNGSYVTLPISFPNLFAAVSGNTVAVALPGVVANNNVGIETAPYGLTRFIARSYQDGYGEAENITWIAVGF